MDILHREDNNRGAFFIEQGGQRIAEMTYSRADAQLIIIDHTEVSDTLKGQGVARRLLDALADWARASRTKVMATCPYALAQLKKDPSLRDIR